MSWCCDPVYKRSKLWVGASAINDGQPLRVSVSYHLHQALSSYFPEGSKVPAVLEQLQQQYKPSSSEGKDAVDDGDARQTHAAMVAEAGLAAYGLMVQFLKDNMLDRALLPNARYEELCDGVSSKV